MRAAEIFERWRAAREGAPAELSPAVPGPRFEAGTLGNADKSGLSPLSPVVPAGIEQGCNVVPREAERERVDDAGPGDAPEADDAAPEPMPLPFRLAAWGDAADVPRPGDTCGTCSRRSPRGGRWWCEATAPKGWRCARCHPADHMPEAERFEVLT
jgi:hypothetical protein